MVHRIPIDKREKAHDLYVYEGLSHKAISKLTGISVSQLQRWGRAEGWIEERKKSMLAISQIKIKLTKLKLDLLEKALNTKNSQDVYALARVFQISDSRQDALDFNGNIDDALKDPKQAIKELEESVCKQVMTLTENPNEITGEKIKQIDSAFDVIKNLKEKYGIKEDTKTNTRIDKNKVKDFEEKWLGLRRQI